MTKVLDEFFSTYPVLRYDKDQIIIHADDMPSGIFYIKSGFVKMSSILENGREITLNIFKAGAYFPMIWAITNLPNTYYYKTVTATEFQRVPRDVVIEFVKKNPDELFELMARILRGMKGLLVNMEHQLSGDSYHRVIAALILAAKRFGTKIKNDKVLIKLPLTHQNIADESGMTRETASLAMKKLAEKKFITYKGRTLLINDMNELIKESTIYDDVNPTPNVL